MQLLGKSAGAATEWIVTLDHWTLISIQIGTVANIDTVMCSKCTHTSSLCTKRPTWTLTQKLYSDIQRTGIHLGTMASPMDAIAMHLTGIE